MRRAAGYVIVYVPSVCGHVTPPMAIAHHPAGVGGALRDTVFFLFFFFFCSVARRIAKAAILRFSRVTECNAALCYQSRKNIFTGEIQD